MSRLPDEPLEMIEDSISKKRAAQSARHRRTHCGKSGSVKFPSDYMTKKELKAMNGECKSYRLNDPMYTKLTIPSDVPQYTMPKSGSLHFECSADNAINVIHEILQNNKVSLNIQWTLMED